MNTMFSVAAMGVATLGLATQAEAFKLSPPSTHFTATGATTLSAPGFPQLNCTSTFTGTTTATGHAKITGFTASGGTGCSSVMATLPWTAKAINANTAKFSKVQVGIPGVVNCGPGSINATDNATGLVSFNGTISGGTGCSVSGNVQTTPAITIVP